MLFLIVADQLDHPYVTLSSKPNAKLMQMSVKRINPLLEYHKNNGVVKLIWKNFVSDLGKQYTRKKLIEPVSDLKSSGLKMRFFKYSFDSFKK